MYTVRGSVVLVRRVVGETVSRAGLRAGPVFFLFDRRVRYRYGLCIATLKTGERRMTRWYQLVMDSTKNPLSNIPDTNTRHMIMQVLAWMWCIVFSFWMGSIVVFGISALVHAILLAGIFITLGVFETAKRKPQYFGGLGRGNGGEHD